MSWEEDFKKKITTPEEAISRVKNGDRVCFVQGNEPQALGLALAGRFGELEITGSEVVGFAEKPEVTSSRVSGGFFVLDHGVFDYIQGDVFFEQAPLTRLAHEGQLGCYLHDGFWQCMDTPAERDRLNELWETGAPWAVWQGKERA